jgi:hypothetical protein
MAGVTEGLGKINATTAYDYLMFLPFLLAAEVFGIFKVLQSCFSSFPFYSSKF